MASKVKPAADDPTQLLERIKKLAVMAMFSDDEFFGSVEIRVGQRA